MAFDFIRTPHKINRLVVTASGREGQWDSQTVDCPFVFSHEGRYYMTAVGFDGIGYRTGLASSDDLVAWRPEAMILDRGPAGSVTQYNAALTCILRDNELYGPGSLKTVGGRFVGTYHAYPQPGCEIGPAVIGLCWSDDLRHWEVGQPVLRPEAGGAWERGGLYKSWLMEHDGTYYLFYNAKHRPEWPWIEQTGVATSRDLKTWTRYAGSPVIPNGPAGAFDEHFASDPCVMRHGGKWFLFYFGIAADWRGRDGAAVSDDLLTWRKIEGVLIDVGPSGGIDEQHAHKPAMIARDGVLFHFYCGVGSQGRGITFATSKPVE